MMGFAASNRDTEVPVDETNIIDSFVKSITSWSNDNICAVIFEEIKIKFFKDQEMLDLVRAIGNKDESDRFPDTEANYNRHSDNLLVVDGVPMIGSWVIVPANCRNRVLDSLHSAHKGPAKC